MTNEEQLELYQRFCDGDDDAFALLKQYFWPQRDQEGVHLVEWAMWTFGLIEYDAEDVVAAWWFDVYTKKPKITKNFKAYAFKGIRWRILNLWRQRKAGKKPWNKPWVAKTNQFHLPAADAKEGMREAEEWSAFVDARYKAAHRAHLLHLAALQHGIAKLPPKQRKAIQLRLDGLTLNQAAFASDMTLWLFRKLEEEAHKSLRKEIFKILNGLETDAERDALLMQWGEIRPDLHWVPDDANQKCDYSAYKRIRRDFALRRTRASLPDWVGSPTLKMTVLIMDCDGYMVSETESKVTFFTVKGGICQKEECVAI